jgi:hypothetical protein
MRKSGQRPPQWWSTPRAVFLLRMYNDFDKI